MPPVTLRRVSIRTERLCAQVRRAIEFALAGDTTDPVLLDLTVEDVQAPHGENDLRVTLAARGEAADLGREDLMQRVEAAKGVMLQEVARTITRRKLPELHFELIRGG